MASTNQTLLARIRLYDIGQEIPELTDTMALDPWRCRLARQGDNGATKREAQHPDDVWRPAAEGKGDPAERSSPWTGARPATGHIPRAVFQKLANERRK